MNMYIVVGIIFVGFGYKVGCYFVFLGKVMY